MKNIVLSDRPTIYADMNVYRYIAYGDISIERPERFKWVYSHVHLDEIVRNGNTDALEGMRLLNAIEVDDVLNDKFESVGNVILRGYIDPKERYEQHLEAIAGFEDQSDFMVEHLLRFFGADNFEELSLTPENLRKEIDYLTSKVPDDMRSELLERAEDVSFQMKETIDTHLRERRPIDKTRIEMGLNSGVRKKAENSESPIDELWRIIAPSTGEVTKNQFFGFEPIPGIEGVQHTQHGAFTGAHIVLNMLGLNPDQGLARRDKIKNIMSDGQHVGMASYCNSLLSADKRFCDKASAIYNHAGLSTNSLWFKYEKGLLVKLGISEPDNDT